MILSEFDQIIKEHFDMTDRPTRQYIIGLDEAGNDQLLAALSARLYDNIVNKVGDIDFGTIPRSRGDITKVEKFDMTTESLDIVRRLVLEYKENTAQVDTILTAIENVKDNKSLFVKGYALNVELPMLIYNTVVLSVIRSTSLIIATCVNYVADPATKSMKMAFDKVAYKDTESDVLYQQLVTFNEMCKDGSLVKLLNSVIKNNKVGRGLREDIEMSDLNTVPNGFDSNVEPDSIDDIQDDNISEPIENPVGDTAPNNTEVPLMATPAQNQLPKTEDNVPDDDAVIAGDANVAPQPSDVPVVTPDVPATNPTPEIPAEVPPTANPSNISPAIQPVIPENRMATTGTVKPAVVGTNENVDKNIETDSTFEKELSGVKESPVDDKDDEKLRDGKEKYDSDQVEAIKQKIIGAAQEAAQKDFIKSRILAAYNEESDPIEDKDDEKLRDGKEKYDSNNTEGEDQEVIGKALESASEGPIEDKDAEKLRDGKEKYDSNKVEGENQEPVGKALESTEVEEAIDPNQITKVASELGKKAGSLKDSAGLKIAKGAGIVIGAIAATKMIYSFFIKVAIPWLRNAVYSIYYAKMKISDYFQIQAELIEANANELENTTADDDDKKIRVIQKQRKWADRFRKWSNMFNVDRTASEKQAQDEMKKEEKDKAKVGKNDTGDDILF